MRQFSFFTVFHGGSISIITVPGVSFPVIQLPAFNGFGDGAEIPGDPALTVQLLPGLLAQLVLRHKSCHEHHSLPMAYLQYSTEECRRTGTETEK